MLIIKNFHLRSNIMLEKLTNYILDLNYRAEQANKFAKGESLYGSGLWFGKADAYKEVINDLKKLLNI